MYHACFHQVLNVCGSLGDREMLGNTNWQGSVSTALQVLLNSHEGFFNWTECALRKHYDKKHCFLWSSCKFSLLAPSLHQQRSCWLCVSIKLHVHYTILYNQCTFCSRVVFFRVYTVLLYKMSILEFLGQCQISNAIQLVKLLSCFYWPFFVTLVL